MKPRPSDTLIQVVAVLALALSVAGMVTVGKLRYGSGPPGPQIHGFGTVDDPGVANGPRFEGRLALEPPLSPEHLSRLREVTGDPALRVVPVDPAEADLLSEELGMTGYPITWHPSEDGTALEPWVVGGVVFFESSLGALIDRYLEPWGYAVRGELSWEDDDGRRGLLVARGGEVSTRSLAAVTPAERRARIEGTLARIGAGGPEPMDRLRALARRDLLHLRSCEWMPSLLEGLGHERPGLRRTFVELVGEVGRLADVQRRFSEAGVPTTSPACLREVVAAAPALGSLARDGDAELAPAALTALVELGPEGHRVLFDLFPGLDVERRCQAFGALGEQGWWAAGTIAWIRERAEQAETTGEEECAAAAIAAIQGSLDGAGPSVDADGEIRLSPETRALFDE